MENEIIKNYIMKKKIFILVLLLFILPCMVVHAADVTMKSGKKVTGTYAGPSEENYNYYKIKASSDGFIAITVKTSDKKSLTFDICDKDKQAVATDITVDNKKTVLHKAEKNNEYYLKIKGNEGVNYTISYKMKSIDEMKYAKKYNYIFTNASFNSSKNAISFKIKTNQAGILQFMFNTDNPLNVKFTDSKKKAISGTFNVSKNAFSGIGITANKTVYVNVWNDETEISGTTCLSGVKYQIDLVTVANGKTRGKARNLSKGNFAETLVPAGSKTTSWFKFKVSKKQKVSITVESHMLQNNGKKLQLYICNSDGKKINTSPIVLDGKTEVIYKKKYIMKYPKTTFGTTAEFPEGTYYLLMESKTATSSGSYKIKWQ